MGNRMPGLRLRQENSTIARGRSRGSSERSARKNLKAMVDLAVPFLFLRAVILCPSGPVVVASSDCCIVKVKAKPPCHSGQGGLVSTLQGQGVPVTNLRIVLPALESQKVFRHKSNTFPMCAKGAYMASHTTSLSRKNELYRWCVCVEYRSKSLKDVRVGGHLQV